jgi:hypothetical protein
MADLIKIIDWAENFEVNRTRELKVMKWIALPNKMDGDGYTELVAHKNGAAHFGAWVILLEVASKCNPRGTLVRDNGEPHTSQSLARISRLPAGVFTEVLPRLQSIGWIELISIPQEGAAISHKGAPVSQVSAPTGQDITEQNITSHHNTEKGSARDRKMKRPTMLDCVEYGKSIDFEKSECENFHNFQTSKGWKVGISPMKDWQASMRTWKGKNDNTRNNTGQAGGTNQQRQSIAESRRAEQAARECPEPTTTMPDI